MPNAAALREAKSGGSWPFENVLILDLAIQEQTRSAGRHRRDLCLGESWDRNCCRVRLALPACPRDHRCESTIMRRRRWVTGITFEPAAEHWRSEERQHSLTYRPIAQAGTGTGLIG
jgi:hypothetical protein